jgi:hypothetical protein
MLNALATRIIHTTKIEGTRDDFSTFENQVAGHRCAANQTEPNNKNVFQDAFISCPLLC